MMTMSPGPNTRVRPYELTSEVTLSGSTLNLNAGRNIEQSLTAAAAGNRSFKTGSSLGSRTGSAKVGKIRKLWKKVVAFALGKSGLIEVGENHSGFLLTGIF